VDAPQWLYDLMDLLDLDVVEQATWIRCWNGDLTFGQKLLDRSQTWEARSILLKERRIEELYRRGLITRRTVLQCRAQEMGLAFVELDVISIDRSAFHDVSRDLVTETSALPVKRDGSTLWIAISSNNTIALDGFRKATGCRVVPVLAEAEDIESAIEKYFP
jgi:hypothetical protein